MTSDNSDARSERLNHIIAAYLAEVEAGIAPDRDEFIGRHPDLADDLRSYFAHHERVQADVDLPTLPPRQADWEAAGTEPAIVGQLFGPYRINGLLGQGGMGEVYEAEHTESGRLVALKVLNHTLESPEHRQRFLREGRLAASINHPNNIYIYGTEEVNGVPVISMELARSGTLQDRVKREGPLPVGDAVDVTLEIIAGLEAAESAGVLHRDVKPSNCFVDADGTVKIGDFGLSISTSPRTDTNLTKTGVFLGTPAFSSPEQLRGEKLDIRSDIYSTGVTLYFLLTGQTPFQAPEMVQLLAKVLERPAPSARGLRPDLPPGLDKIVLRCLAKRSDRRFKTYDELRRALLPYRSKAPTPGTVGFRILASGIDYLVLTALAALLPLLWVTDMGKAWQPHFEAIWDPGPVPAQMMLFACLGMLMHLAYYAVLEGIWGATAGKAICRLRVVQSNREPPGVQRATLRGTVFYAFLWLPWWVLYAFDQETSVAAFAADEGPLLAWPMGIAVASYLGLFCTMRRGNGYAGVHELASGTRVVRLAVQPLRPAVEAPDQPLPETRGSQQIGPYEVLGPLSSEPIYQLLLAYDTKLLRRVWIRTCPSDAPPVDSKLRELARIGRLRWLNGERGEKGGWDAYEALAGESLLRLIDTPQSWEKVRFWLLDLAEELNASLSDNSLPKDLDLDRVWITTAGRAKLLDFPTPDLNTQHRVESESQSDTPDAAMVAIFLRQVAIAALEGIVVSREEVSASHISMPIPLSARKLLDGLDGSAGTEIPILDFQILTERPASISRARRAGVRVASCLVPILMAAYVMTLHQSEKRVLRTHPQVGELCGFVNFHRSLDSEIVNEDIPAAELRDAVEIVVVHRYRNTINDSEIWSDPAAESFIDKDGQQLLKRLVQAHPEIPLQDIRDAERRLKPLEGEIRFMGWSPYEPPYSQPMSAVYLQMFMMFVVLFVAFPSLLSAVLFGNSLLLRCFGIAIVKQTGAEASRLRVVLRNTALWSLILLAIGLTYLLMDAKGPFVILLIYLIAHLFMVERGPHDVIASTTLVPR